MTNLGLFYCFSCGTGGDMFTFVKNQEMCSLLEATEKMTKSSTVQHDTIQNKEKYQNVQ